MQALTAEHQADLGIAFDGDADVVYGSRFLGGPHRVLYYWHSVGNAILTTVSNMITDLNLTDMETCYKVMRAPVARALPLTADRFDIEPEITGRELVTNLLGRYNDMLADVARDAAQATTTRDSLPETTSSRRSPRTAPQTGA